MQCYTTRHFVRLGGVFPVLSRISQRCSEGRRPPLDYKVLTPQRLWNCLFWMLGANRTTGKSIDLKGTQQTNTNSGGRLCAYLYMYYVYIYTWVG